MNSGRYVVKIPKDTKNRDGPLIISDDPIFEVVYRFLVFLNSFNTITRVIGLHVNQKSNM